MVFRKMKPIPPLKMENETYQCTKRAFGQSKKPRLKSLLKAYMKVKSK